MQIVLSDEERAELARRAGLPGRWRADRARIILACAEGMSIQRGGDVGAGMGVHAARDKAWLIYDGQRHPFLW